LVRSRRDRDEARSFVIEGPTLVDEALAAGLFIDALYLSQDHEAPHLARSVADAGGEVWTLDPGVLASIASTETPRPVLATTGFIDVDLDTALDQASESGAVSVPLIVVAAGVGEPGNLGTIVRSALGAGATAVITCDGTVDLYNPKVVRAAAGALFRIPVVRDADAGVVAEALESRSVRSLGLDAGGTVSIDVVDLTAAVALVVGNEAHGLSPQVRSRLDDSLSIPLQGGLESLNAASALTVTCFEAARQRRVG
jgi:TrmH family RNA methyltransferase